MKTADIFLASAEQRSNKVIAAYRNVAMELDKVRAKMQILNMWVMKLPEYINDNEAAIPDQEELADAIDTLSHSMAKLQAEFEANKNATKHLEDVLLFHRKYGATDKII